MLSDQIVKVADSKEAKNTNVYNRRPPREPDFQHDAENKKSRTGTITQCLVYLIRLGMRRHPDKPFQIKVRI